jgi:hypothetical protein
MKKLATEKDFKDPFNAGQMVGMMMMLSMIEKNNGISEDALTKIKWSCATNAQHYLEKAPEDIFLMVNNMIKDIEIQ